jgi:hypothetical protein
MGSHAFFFKELRPHDLRSPDGGSVTGRLVEVLLPGL